MATRGEYGTPVNAEGVLKLSHDGEIEAEFFRGALAGRRRVLDLGCGPGFPLVVLSGHVGGIWGVDASPAMLNHARRAVSALGISDVECMECLAQALPFRDGFFDGASVCGTLGSVSDPYPVVSELARVCSPGSVVASLEQDFRWRLGDDKPREEQRIRLEEDGNIRVQAVSYLTEPYRIRTEYAVIDRESDTGRQLLASGESSGEVNVSGRLELAEIPDSAVLDAFCEEERQYDPESLQTLFDSVGFDLACQEVALSYGAPHIFSRFARGS